MDTPIELRTPDQVFNGDNLPDDLKWLMSEFKLPKSDPAVVLMAWHWHRVANTQDLIKVGQMELIAALESRIEKMRDFAQQIVQVNANLEQVGTELSNAHLNLRAKINSEFKQPIEESLSSARETAASLQSLLQQIKSSGAEYHRRRWWAAYWGGISTGIIITACACWLLFAH